MFRWSIWSKSTFFIARSIYELLMNYRTLWYIHQGASSNQSVELSRQFLSYHILIFLVIEPTFHFLFNFRRLAYEISLFWKFRNFQKLPATKSSKKQFSSLCSGNLDITSISHAFLLYKYVFFATGSWIQDFSHGFAI